MLKNERGFTLIELMIALALSLILSITFLQTMLIIKNIHKKQEGLARIQENARSIHHIIGTMIAHSGTLGCNRMSDEIRLKINEGVNSERLGLFPFQGFKLGNYTIPILPIEPDAESDLLWIKYTKKSYSLAYASRGETGTFVIQGRPNWKKNRVVVVSDCRQAEIISLADKVKNIRPHYSKIQFKYNAHEFREYEYQANAKVARLHSILLYVAKTKRKNQYNDVIYALYSTDLNGKTQERIEGVEKMKFEYGVMQNDALVYFPKEQLRGNEEVRVVRASILLNSVEPVKTEAGDTLLRQWWHWEWGVYGRS